MPRAGNCIFRIFRMFRELVTRPCNFCAAGRVLPVS
jgi:hypothetical protein